VRIERSKSQNEQDDLSDLEDDLEEDQEPSTRTEQNSYDLAINALDKVIVKLYYIIFLDSKNGRL
jgi:hypothetical protein